MTVLVAGIGNVFRRDDGFGVEVVRRLAARGPRPGVELVDFGIRGYDLALALSNKPAAAIIVDAAARGGAPGTLYVLEPSEIEGQTSFDPHGMCPLNAFKLARALGGLPAMLRIVACEPGDLGTEEEPDTRLTTAVAAAIEEAMRLVTELAHTLEPNHA